MLGGKSLDLDTYREEINACHRSIEEIQMFPGGGEDPMLIEKKNRLSTLLAQEDAFWKQWAKVYWLVTVIQILIFFHAMASARKRRNYISNLIQDHGSEATAQHEMCNTVQTFPFQLHSDKAPIPDDLNLAFFKRFWNLCGMELFHTRTKWLETGEFPMTLNDTDIVLFHKVDNPTSMKDLRLISLCNVMYKIISKVIAKRLKPLLLKCIAMEQSIFVEN